MLLSSIGRASCERAVTTISCSKYRAVHILLNAHRIKSSYFRKESFTSDSIDFSRQSYATAARSASGVKQKSKLSSTKSRLPASKSKVAKFSKKASSILKKKKIVKKVVKKTKKLKKALTEKEKLTRKQTSLKLFALKLPDKLPQTARTIFMADKLRGNGGDNINTRFGEISKSWKNISPSELQVYQKQSEINRAANAKSLKEWIYKHSPDQIRLANNARRQLSRIYPKSNQWRQIQDDRQPKRPVTQLLCYIKERYSTGEYEGANLPEISKKLSSEFNALTPNDRKKYDDIFRENRLKYIEDFRQTFNRDPKCQKSVVE